MRAILVLVLAVSACSASCSSEPFTQDATDLCVSVAQSGSLVVGVYVGCNGFDVITYPTIDTGEFALYRPPDDRRVGSGSWGPVGPAHATIDGTPQPFDLFSCAETSTVRCAPP